MSPSSIPPPSHPIPSPHTHNNKFQEHHETRPARYLNSTKYPELSTSCVAHHINRGQNTDLSRCIWAFQSPLVFVSIPTDNRLNPGHSFSQDCFVSCISLLVFFPSFLLLRCCTTAFPLLHVRTSRGGYE